MLESTPKRERNESVESPRIRLEVRVGPRGSFDEEKKAASREGIEEIDPRFAGKGPAISSVSELSKRSLDYTVCTGLIAIGRGKEGRNLSCVTHLIPTTHPDSILEYRMRIRDQLTDLAFRTDPRTGDFGFFGGEKATDIQPDDPERERLENRNAWYDKMYELVREVVREVASREVRVIDGPHLPGQHADMLLDTEHACVYIERD